MKRIYQYQEEPSSFLAGKKPFAKTNVGGALAMLLQNAGGIAQIIGAVNGNGRLEIPVAGGGTKDVTNEVKTEVQKLANQNNKSVEQMLQLMFWQLQKEKKEEPKKEEKDNSLLYVGIGLGVLALVGVGFVVIKNSTKN